MDSKESTARVKMAGGRRLPHLPLVRFTSLATLFVAVDSLVCVCLWIAGGDSRYMEDSVRDFSFTHSTFDLACLAAVRGVILVACLYYLEHFSLVEVSVRNEDRLITSRRIALLCRVSLFLISSVSLLYAAVKGAVILHEVLSDSWISEAGMHVTYEVLCITSVVFPVAEVGIGVASWWYIRRLTLVSQLQVIINEGSGEREKGETLRKKADLKRLVLLAKPVSSQICMHVHVVYEILCRNGPEI